MDWGERLLHVQRHEHRVHLAVPQAHARAWLALPRPSLDGVVPALRDLALAARALAVRRLPGAQRPVALRPASRSSSAGTSRSSIWTTTPWTLPANVAAAVKPDAEYGLRPNGEWVAVARYPRGAVHEDAHRQRARRASLRGPFDIWPRRAEVEHRVIPWDEVSARGGNRRRPHRTRLRRGGLRALAHCTSSRCSRPVDESGRFYDSYGWLHGLSTGDAADQIVGRPRRAGLPARGRHVPPPLPALLALRHPAHLPHVGRLVHRRRRAPAAVARRERDGRVDARLHGQAHGRLAQEHGGLEHLAAPLLRPAAPVLPLRVRAPERDRLEGGARGARHGTGRRAGGAEATVGRRDPDPLRGLRRGGRADHRGRRRLARRRHRPVLDTRLGEPGVRAGGIRDRRRERADARRPPGPRLLGGVVPGRLGLGDARADPALVLLAALHVGRADGPRAVPPRYSATRRCSTRRAARCTARGGT